MNIRPLPLAFWSILSVGFLLAPDHGLAAKLVDTEELMLQVEGNAAVVAGAEVGEETTAEYGTRLSLARLKLQGERPGLGKFKLQVGGAGGEVVLKDAAVTLTALDPVEIRAGRFKTAISDEDLVSSSELPMIERTLLNRYVPGRQIGTEVTGRFPLGEVDVRAQAGLFSPGRASFEEPAGQLLTGRLLGEFPAGIDVHVGYAEHLFAANRRPGSEASAPEADRRVLPYDSTLDAAVTYEDDRLRLRAETLHVLDPPGDRPVHTYYTNAGYRFGPSGGLQFEPTAAYDMVFEQGDMEHRAAGGLNLHFWETGFYTTLNYWMHADEELMHSVFIRLTGVI